MFCIVAKFVNLYKIGRFQKPYVLMKRGKNDRVLSHLVKYPALLNVSGFKDKPGTHGLYKFF